ncbi:NAD(P)-binding protein [Eremomyces bilateralis CBS 781.70]|uniref:NAD(P)-binding protein n=1 Tax=Eremomyces bilateralis CBS 781.70 TaxID=1392243 RepID=A0A6G1GH96_9PEZI|nr:NAD(P)-binding protein [Eremomyces bilateralis CBS 781.70]KAF1817240.1 NAD(P)-binding protein [Eremomyces bilateralis CBS 781.70]
MTILLIGGTGKTTTRVAKLLSAANQPFHLTSRRGPDAAPHGYPAIKFDWTDETTWAKPFEKGDIDAVYMMEPGVSQPWVPMIKFVDFARDKGVKRFVLCTGSSAQFGQDGMGRVWEHYVNTGVDYCVLRPSWFMENLVEPGLLYTIGQLNTIFTACQDGQIPFISADDIAEVAFHALTDEKSHNCDHRILGPELLTYDDIAATLSKVLGRKIEHVKQDKASRCQGMIQAGVSEYVARLLTNLEVIASTNFEKRLGDAVETVTGHPPKSFDTFAEENKTVWSQ